jgi:MFS family permease
LQRIATAQLVTDAGKQLHALYFARFASSFGLVTLATAFLPLVALNALLGFADSIREPASMALFADEGKGTGVAYNFGVRDLVWRPGSVLAPLAGGWLTSNPGTEWVFFLCAGAAFSGVAAFPGYPRVHSRPRGADGVVAARHGGPDCDAAVGTDWSRSR